MPAIDRKPRRPRQSRFCILLARHSLPLVRAEDKAFVFEIDFDVLELTQNVLAKNAVDLSMHCVSDALHILYENAIVLPNYRCGHQRRFPSARLPPIRCPF